MKYNLNFGKILSDLLPWFIKKSDEIVVWADDEDAWASGGNIWSWINGSTTYAYFISILKGGIGRANTNFRNFVSGQLYFINITGQVIYLERILNDLYDPTFRRIYITDAAVVLPPYVYALSDAEPPLYIYDASDMEDPFYIYTLDEYYTNPEFIVHVPVARNIFQNQIKRIINKYKLAAAKYAIEYF